MGGLPQGRDPGERTPDFTALPSVLTTPQCLLLAEPQRDPGTNREQFVQGGFLRRRVEKGGKRTWRVDTEHSMGTVGGFLVRPQRSLLPYLPQTASVLPLIKPDCRPLQNAKIRACAFSPRVHTKNLNSAVFSHRQKLGSRRRESPRRLPALLPRSPGVAVAVLTTSRLHRFSPLRCLCAPIGAGHETRVGQWTQAEAAAQASRRLPCPLVLRGPRRPHRESLPGLPRGGRRRAREPWSRAGVQTCPRPAEPQRPEGTQPESAGPRGRTRSRWLFLHAAGFGTVR